VFRMEYIITLLFWLIVAAAIHFHYRLKLYKNVKQTVVIVGSYFIVGVAWDMIEASREHWTFGYENLIGIRLGVLPIEELLFMLIVPYGILVFYKFFGMKIN
jgi:lycopene cyclase domain-containing protein